MGVRIFWWNTFLSFRIFCFKVTSPLYFLNIHFDTKIQFYHFSVLIKWDERKAITRIQLRKSFHFNNFGHQNIRFLCHMVLYNEGSIWIRCFVTLKIPIKKNIYELGKKLGFKLILSFGQVFYVFRGEGWVEQDYQSVF